MSLVFILHDRCERGCEAVAKTSANVVNRLAIAIIVNFRALPFTRRGNEASCSSASLRIRSSSPFKRCSSSFLSRSFSSSSFRSRSFSSSSLTLRSASSFSSLTFSSASALARVFSRSFSREPFPSLVLSFHANTSGPPGGCPRTALSVHRTLDRQKQW